MEIFENIGLLCNITNEIVRNPEPHEQQNSTTWRTARISSKSRKPLYQIAKTLRKCKSIAEKFHNISDITRHPNTCYWYCPKLVPWKTSWKYNQPNKKVGPHWKSHQILICRYQPCRILMNTRPVTGIFQTWNDLLQQPTNLH